MKEKGCYCLCCLTLKADQVTTDNGPNKRSWGKFVFCLFRDPDNSCCSLPFLSFSLSFFSQLLDNLYFDHFGTGFVGRNAKSLIWIHQ